jgi:hypothetical protein
MRCGSTVSSEWLSNRCNRRADASEAEGLCIPEGKARSRYHVPHSAVTDLLDPAQLQWRRSRLVGLFDVLALVLNRFGHVDGFLEVDAAVRRKSEKARKTRQKNRAKKKKKPATVKTAMEAAGLDWSQRTWDEEKKRWSLPDCTAFVWWDRTGAGRWRMYSAWLTWCEYERGDGMRKIHRVLEGLGLRPSNCNCSGAEVCGGPLSSRPLRPLDRELCSKRTKDIGSWTATRGSSLHLSSDPLCVCASLTLLGGGCRSHR